MKPGKFNRTHQPHQGLVAFVRLAEGLASMGHGPRTSAQAPFVPAGHCRLDRTGDQAHPGEEHA